MTSATLPDLIVIAILTAILIAACFLFGLAPLIIGFGLQFLVRRRPLPGWIAPLAGTAFTGVFWLMEGHLPVLIFGGELFWVSAIVSAIVSVALDTCLFKWGAGLCRWMFARRALESKP